MALDPTRAWAPPLANSVYIDDYVLIGLLPPRTNPLATAWVFLSSELASLSHLLSDVDLFASGWTSASTWRRAHSPSSAVLSS